ncbi:substrate-binding domain-containing protein [Paenibacillus protaetiae]|uniref:Periplasmic binding protein domain-containing protein n=1 Tax=Paenibacillus protaetiae TaxID=2509456 RepID=A0A4P6EXR1_9BACL|nr:substrate-binding domain-containing protein [Paenibacillus protaetiae]QAY67455.1 hypothetical protein ET464_14725 [Paenibacillus protaetiae]
MNKTYRSYWLGGLMLAAAALLLVSAWMPSLFGGKPKHEEKTIQLIMRTSEGSYWNNIASGAEAAVKEFGVNVHTFAAEDEGDVGSQVEKAMMSLDEKPDAIVLGASDDAAFAPFLKEADKRGIPVVAIDSLLTSGKTVSYIGIDNRKAGREALRQMSEMLGGKGRIAILSSSAGGINGKLREQGIREAAAEAGSGIHIVSSQQCSQQYGECQEAVRRLLEAEKVDGIISLNTDTTAGAATELQRRQAGGQIKLIGFDSSDELLELLQDGQLQALIVQNPFSIGYLGVKYALAAAKGEPVPAKVDMDMKIINKFNMFWMENQKLLFPVVQ